MAYNLRDFDGEEADSRGYGYGAKTQIIDYDIARRTHEIKRRSTQKRQGAFMQELLHGSLAGYSTGKASNAQVLLSGTLCTVLSCVLIVMGG